MQSTFTLKGLLVLALAAMAVATPEANPKKKSSKSGKKLGSGNDDDQCVVSTTSTLTVGSTPTTTIISSTVACTTTAQAQSNAAVAGAVDARYLVGAVGAGVGAVILGF